MKQFLDSDYWVTEDGKIWSNKTKRFLSPSPNNKGYLTTTIKHKGEVISEFKTIVDACRYFEKELGGKFSVLRRFYKSGDYEIKKV